MRGRDAGTLVPGGMLSGNPQSELLPLGAPRLHCLSMESLFRSLYLTREDSERHIA